MHPLNIFELWGWVQKPPPIWSFWFNLTVTSNERIFILLSLC